MPGNVFLPLNCVVEHLWDPTQPHHHPELSASSTAPPTGSPQGLRERKRRRRMDDGVPGPIPAAAAHEGDEAVRTVPFAELELAHGEAVAPAAGVTVRGEDLLLVLLRLDVLLPLLLAVAVLPAEPAVVAHLTGAERGQRASQGVNTHSHRPSPHRHCVSPPPSRASWKLHSLHNLPHFPATSSSGHHAATKGEQKRCSAWVYLQLKVGLREHDSPGHC